MLLLAIFAAVAAARVFDSLPAVPRGWTEVRAADPSEPISLRIALPQQRAAALEQAVLDMSTPGHARYGRHMSRDEVRSHTAPAPRSVDRVRAWLAAAGVERPLVDNDWVTVQTTVARAGALLDARFAWYRHEDDDGDGGDEREKGAAAAPPPPRLRTLAYSVPDAVAPHVDMVQPTTRFGRMARQRSPLVSVVYDDEDETATKEVLAGADTAAAAGAVCGSRVTPDCLKNLYDIHYTASADGNLVAFGSYLNEYARYDDLAAFEDRYVPAAAGQSFNVTLINGGLDDQDSSSDSGEANLDVQYVLGVSNPIPVLEYSTGGLGPLVPTKDQPTQPGNNEPYLEFLTFVLALDDADLPQTLTTSYGEEEQSVPREYALRVCNLFMQLGARGVSVLFSSGDSGPGNSCERNTDGAAFFNPVFPAACPWVTSVGATTGEAPERAVAFSSGGFSTYWDRPAWQDDAVAAYLDGIGGAYAPYFNATGRGFPDVAAQGQAFAVIDKGRSAALSGTSASSPAFAGVVALLNAARRSQGAAPLGFLNPWLYNNSAALTDVTTGYGSGCTGNSAFPNGARWNATAGWDPVTGLGTPKFGDLLEAAAPGVANA